MPTSLLALFLLYILTPIILSTTSTATTTTTTTATTTTKPTEISLSLNPILPQTQSSLSSSSSSSNEEYLYQTLYSLSSSSLTRAKHLKKPQQKTSPLNTPIFPQTFGGYSITLKFGTPPQKSNLVLDTGSEIVWIPCTPSYSCKHCSFLSHSQTPPFLPKSSSSSKLIGCLNPKCNWIHQNSFIRSKCSSCSSNSPSNCSQVCPPYLIIYGSGSTAGLYLSETLTLPHSRMFANFGVGCSILSTRIPAGIAGFGRGSASLPAQLGVTQFSYCLLSHRFDGSPKSSPLVLGSSAASNVSHTPFAKNPIAGNPAFGVYYYISLRKISVGGNSVNLPYQYLRVGSDGNGGTIVDSGTTFTYMESQVFEPVAREILAQVGNRYRRATAIEERTGLRPCFDVSGDGKSVSLPKLVFHFKGGADMDLPLPNYFSLVGDSNVACLTIITGVEALQSGPSIILGNYQQQNFYVEYDLKREKFGFKRQLCGM